MKNQLSVLNASIGVDLQDNINKLKLAVMLIPIQLIKSSMTEKYEIIRNLTNKK